IDMDLNTHPLLPDISVASPGAGLKWHSDDEQAWLTNPNAGGVDLTYTISGVNLTSPAPVVLYWADSQGKAISGAPAITKGDGGAPLMTQTAVSLTPYKIHIPGAQLGIPPKGASELLAIVDPTDATHPVGQVIETIEPNNQVTLDASASAIVKNSVV